jgi:cytochrome c553
VAAKLLDDLALLATGTALPPAALAERARLERGEGRLESYVDALLADEQFASAVAPDVLLTGTQRRLNSWAVPGKFLLKSFQGPQGTVYHLRKPCAPSQAVSVSPWWAPETRVRVCPDSYRPEVTGDAKSGYRCGGGALNPEFNSLCGCGAGLVHCFRDAGQRGAFVESLRKEVRQTLAYVVGRDLPLAQAFLMNETVRDRNAEFTYRRWRLAQGEAVELKDLEEWPEEGRLAPRHESVPGQHAGILTAAHLAFQDTPRQTLREYGTLLWCVSHASVGVSASSMLSLGALDLRQGEGWRQLATRPVCAGCHARLDYGMQFVAGYPGHNVAVAFDPAAQKPGMGPLYIDGAEDLRGQAPLTPRGFAQLSVEQPEFRACVVRRVMEHVFNGRAGELDVRAAQEAFTREGTLRAAMRVALLRFAGRWRQGLPRAPALPGGEGLTPAGGEVRLERGLRARLDEACGACHGSADGEGRLELSGDRLPRETIERMLHQVAFGLMPKTTERLDEQVRLEMVGGLVAALFPDEGSRATAMRYFGTRMRALPVLPTQVLLRQVRARSGAAEPATWTLHENGLSPELMQYTPGVAAVVALEALRGCKAAGHQGEALARCVEEASAPGALMLGSDEPGE